MKRVNQNTIEISQEELDNIREFIETTLSNDRDQYIDKYICSLNWASEMRKMNPSMYDMAQEMATI